MLAEISAGLSSLKTMKDLVQGLNAAKTEAAINSVKIELQSLILEAQQGLFSAQEAQSASAHRIAQLEQEIMQLKDWSAEAQRYQLVNIHLGAVAYMPKPGMENGEPAHWLCANCFNQRRKSFLVFKGQDRRVGGGRGDESNYGCDACKSSFKVSYTKRPTYADQCPDNAPQPPTPGMMSVKLER
jgi:hypothetical protein